MESEVTKEGALTQIAYTYNASGYRTSKTVDGVTTEHLLDGANVAADVANGQVTQYVRGLGLTALVQADGTRLQYVTDGHGDVKKLVSSSGAVVADYTYDAFGNQTEASGDTNPFRYSGEYYDAETGLIYLRARYYDSGVGGFTSEDTHWNVGNMIYGDNNTGIPSIAAILQSGNLYLYCMGNPVMYLDPSGLRYESLRQIAEDAGGTLYWDSNRGVAKVTLNGRTVEYYNRDGKGSFIDGTDSKLYVDGETFARDFGGSYTEEYGAGYEGYTLIFAQDRGQIKVESLRFTYTVDGERLADNFNNRQNEAKGDSMTGASFVAGVLTYGSGKVIGGILLAGTTGLSFGANKIDVSFGLKAGERITVRTTASYAVNGRAGVNYNTIVRNSSGTVRKTAWRSY